MFSGIKYFINFYKYKRKLNKCTLSLNHLRRNSTSSFETAKELKILFFGTDQFSLPSLCALHENSKSSGLLKSLAVVTSFKFPTNCVRRYAELHRLPLYKWPVSPTTCESYNFGVVVSFGHLIPENTINAFPHGMINMHASLLPRWRGAAPIIYAIMNGDKTTGVSIMRVEPRKFDIGDILDQREVPIRQGIFLPDLHAELANEGAKLLIEVIKKFPYSFANARKQQNEYASFAPKIRTAFTEVSWSHMSASQLYARFRALFGFKHLKTSFQGKNVELLDIAVLDAVPSAVEAISKPGDFTYQRDKRCLLVRCANDSFIEVHKIRVEGKMAMTAFDFNNGFLRNLKLKEYCFINKNN